jgi:hypothetical protein
MMERRFVWFSWMNQRFDPRLVVEGTEAQFGDSARCRVLLEEHRQPDLGSRHLRGDGQWREDGDGRERSGRFWPHHLATLGAPDFALFVQNCGQDRLFTQAGMDAAVANIQAVYAHLKRPKRFRGQFYDLPHQFNVEMQEDAFRWLENWLK